MTGPEHKQIHAEMQRVVGKGHKVQDVTRRRIEEMLKAGSTSAEITRAVGVSTSTVSRVGQAAGIFRGPAGKRLTEAEADQLRDRLAARPHEIDDPLTPAESSNKDKLLALIVDHTNAGRLLDEHDITGLARNEPGIRLGGHELTHLLHSLRKQSLIDFRHSPQAPDGRTIKRIVATRAGVQRAKQAANAARNTPAARDDEPYAGAAHDQFIANALLRGRGVEPTAFIRPSKFEWTGPGEEPKPKKLTVTGTAEVIHPQDQRVIDDTPPAAPPLVDDSQPVTAGVFDARYPEIAKLLDREGRINRAAQALEEAGLDDLALAAYAKVDDLSPLEREVIAFIKEAGWTKR